MLVKFFFLHALPEIARVSIKTDFSTESHTYMAMGFQPYNRTFTLYREPGPILRPLSMTRLVQQSFAARKNNYSAFKIVPHHRIPRAILDNLEQQHEWGAQVMFTGGVLGSVITQDLARRTEPDDVLSAEWDMPGLEEGQTFSLYSVMVRSKGHAETFPPDMLMEMHAPDLAEDTRGAHVFHFYEEQSAMLFQHLLLTRIHEVAHEDFRAVS